MTTALENLPEVRSYALAASKAGVVRINGGLYLSLPEGVSTVSVTGHATDVTVYLCTSMSTSARYATRAATGGQSLVLSGVSVPRGESRFLQVVASSPGDVGVTIITYPL